MKELIREHKIEPSQILLLLDCPKNKSCLSGFSKISGYPLQWLDKVGRFHELTIHYTSISLFKGLEVDVVFHLSSTDGGARDIMSTYTSLSRARFLAFDLEYSKT